MNIEIILRTLEEYYRKNGQSDKIPQMRKEFFDMCMFDLLFANRDRSDDNFGVKVNQSTNEINFYPLFDNEQILGMQEEKSDIVRYLSSEKEYQKYKKQNLTSFIGIPEKTQRTEPTTLLQYLLEHYYRHDENWSMQIKGNENIDLYSLYDNERVLGLYENQNFVEDILKNQEVEKEIDEKFFSRMHVPGETKKNSTYKEMLEYLINTYPQETREILQKQLSIHTTESIRNLLEECEGLPRVYIELATQMYIYRNIFAKEVLENAKNLDSLEVDEGR